MLRCLCRLKPLTLCLLAVSAAHPLVACGEPADSSTAAKPKSGAGREFLLRYQFQVNQSVRYRVKSSTVIKMVKGPAKGEARNESVTRKHFTVIAVDKNGNAILEPVIDAVKMSAQYDDRPKTTYDSSSGEDPPKLFAGVAKTVGKPLVRLKVASTGRLIEAVSLISKEDQKKVVKNAGPARPANDPSKNFLVVFPEQPVQVGDSWSNDDLKVSLQVSTSPRLWQNFVILRNYRLVSVKGGKATIELSMAPRKPINRAELKVQLVQRLLSGTIVFDIKQGRILSRHLTGDNKVVGFGGARSLLHVKTDRRERIIRQTDVANRDGKNARE